MQKSERAEYSCLKIQVKMKITTAAGKEVQGQRDFLIQTQFRLPYSLCPDLRNESEV